ncbi:MAG TPA: cytochrome c biogenesis protein ResB, partial [Candidatus Hypogeohydataceae bacterium YC40]
MLSKKNVVQSEEGLLWSFFTSVKLAVALIFLIAIACGLGTFIVQDKTPEEYKARFGDSLASFLQLTQFTQVFHSYWFTLLLVLLATNLVCCTIDRWRGTLLQLGFILTHISIILILTGSIIGLWFGEKGVLWIAEGQKAEQFNLRNGTPRPLPFELHLDSFITEKHPPKYDLLSYVKDQHKEKFLSTELGKPQPIPKSPYAVTIKDYIPDAALLEEAINTSEEAKNPAIFVQLYGSENVAVEGWLVAKDRNWYVDRKRDLKLEYRWVESSEELKKVNVINPSKLTLTVRQKEKNVSQEFQAEVGRSYTWEGYNLKVLDFTLDFTQRTRPLKEQQPNNPGIQVELDGPQGKENRWVFANFPDWDEMHPTKYKELKLLCEIPQDISFVSQQVRILQGPNDQRLLAYIKGDKVVESFPWELEKKYNIGDSGQQIKVTKFYPSFGVKQSVVKRSDELKKPALYVEIDGPRGKITDWVFAEAQQATAYTDGNLFLLYKQMGENIKDWKSKLRIVDGGKTVMEKTIEVNDPLKYKGYAFYQA